MSIQQYIEQQAASQQKQTEEVMRTLQKVEQKQKERDEVMDQVKRLLALLEYQGDNASSGNRQDTVGEAQSSGGPTKSAPRFAAPRLRH